MSRVLKVFAVLGLLSGCVPQARSPADVLLTGGKIFAQDGWREALAVRNGVIVAIGSSRSMDRWRGPETRVIELGGATVFPGLYDVHAHPALAAREQFQPCRMPRDLSWDRIAEVVAECVRKTPAGGWIVTGPIEPSLLGIQATRQALDAVAADHPVLLYAVGTHAAVANSRALKAAGIDRKTPPPPGGVIGRDSDGEPTGVMLDAWQLFAQFMPPPPAPDVMAPAFAWAIDQMLAQGVTSITEAAGDLSYLQAYVILADTGMLKARVRTCLTWAPPLPAGRIPQFAASSRDRLSPTCVKIFIDGETFTARTAALLQPYESGGGAGGDRGTLALQQDVLAAAVTRFDKDGLTVKFHAWGDAAVEAASGAVQAARSANGPGGPRHEIGHIMLATPESIALARQVGAVLEFSPPLWTPGPLAVAGKDVGAARMQRAWPVHDALSAGANTVAGTDWPAPTSTYNPWEAIETLVTHRPPGATTGEPATPSQRISLAQAIALFTSNPAAYSGVPDAPGIIASGRKADIIVLDRDPFQVPISEVHLTRPVTTFVGGEVVYSSAPKN